MTISALKQREFRLETDKLSRNAGVFCDEMPQNILTAVVNKKHEAILLAGSESPIMIRNLRSTLVPDFVKDLTIVKVFEAGFPVSDKMLNEYKGVADYVLFNTNSESENTVFDSNSESITTDFVLPAEWEPQRFVQLTWPHEDTDWAPYLEETYKCYLNIAREILKREDLLIVTQNVEKLKEQLLSAGIKSNEHKIYFAECPLNDTWARDHAFITLKRAGGNALKNAENAGQKNSLLLDFCFNGWGQKFAANLDNQINNRVYKTFADSLFYSSQYVNKQNIVLEGGSIESDGKGTLLTTDDCLLAPNRNGFSDRAEAEEMLRKNLGARQILWLSRVGLSGDDTDSHIDTIARLCPNDTIVFVEAKRAEKEAQQEKDCQSEKETQCSAKHKAQSYGLDSIREQLEKMRTIDGKPFRLLALPLPTALFDEDGECLPATYANFLIINGAVLVPTYGQAEKDAEALDVIRQAFPDREIVGIDCSVLVRQHGSLHCITMQYI